MLNNQTILITGGTGSFGNQVVEKLLETYNPKQIIIFSRDEKKQFDMRNKFHRNPYLKFIIGDVRERDSVFQVMRGVDYVFHASALKQVPTCEFFPYEAVKTNIIGAVNVLDAAEETGVKKVVVLSTDKAVYPINAMGISKAMMEKLMLAKARDLNPNTIYCGVRYGNVMYSRGSVLPLFIEQMQRDLPLTVTHLDMTRYLLPLPIAIDLVLFALEKGENGDILVRKSPAATVSSMAIAMKEIFQYKKEIKIIGIREGEKLHETLVTTEELLKSEEYDNYYRIRNLMTIDYDKYYSEGKQIQHAPDGYTSEIAQRLSLEETKDLILSLEQIQDIIKKNNLATISYNRGSLLGSLDD
jgi:UDP-N-acetylglucosamine 4,6-dehydratase/5-epimerase